MVDGERAALRRVKAGEALPGLSLQSENGGTVSAWFEDEAMTQAWDFDAQRMPYADLFLYATALPRFGTAPYETEDENGSDRTLCPRGAGDAGPA